MESVIKLLLVEDNPGDADLIIEFFSETNLKKSIIEQADNLKDTLALLNKDTFDIVLLDLGLPDSSGLTGLKKIIEINPDIPIVVVSGQDDLTISQEAIQQGAEDYLIKGKIDDEILTRVVLYSIERNKQKRELKAVNQQLQASEQQLQAANQQLTASEQQLRAANQQLTADEQQLKAFNQQLIANEQAIRKSEEFTKRIIASSRDCIKVLDLDGNLLSMSEGGQELLEIDNLEPYLNNSWVDFWKGDDNNAALKAISTAKKGGVGIFSGYSPTEKGIPKWWEIIITPINDANNKIEKLLAISRDVTDRKQAEQHILLSESRYRKAQEIAHVGNWEYNIQTSQFWGSEEAKRIYGFELNSESFTAEEVESCIPDRKSVHQALMDLIEKEKTYDLEFEIITKDKGESRFIRSLAILEKDEKGNALKISGVIHDITDRKQIEAELIKLSATVKQSPSTIVITDTIGRYEYVNPKFTELTGYSFEEVLGQNPRILKSGEQSDEMYKELWETISSGNIWRGEFHNKNKNGELFWEMASVLPIYDEQGKIINYLKVAEDITERKQAEDNFRHSIDESPLGIRIVNQAGKTIYANRAFLGIYDFSSLDEFLNTKAIERYTEKSYQEHQERKKIRQKGGDTSEYEISIRRKNEEIRHIKVWRKELIWNREKHYQVINQDITELKILYNDLILAREKAEESNRLKTAFLNNMSHEIRTPLNGITGFIGLLQDSAVDDEQKQLYFDIINKSSDRLIATVTDIMDISRIEAGEVKVTKTEVSINEILKEQYNFFYSQAQSKGLELIYKPSLSESEARSVTDKHKLERILTNLIKNAIKFTEQGEITFSCSLKKEEDIEVLEFYVKDTGIGITSNRIDAIFNRFEQADIEDTRVHQGSGLGLAIAKSYVEMLGGRVSVTSDEGKGSTFTFSIPFIKQLVTDSDDKQKVNKEPQTSLSHLSVIIAEDDETSVMFFNEIINNTFNKIIYAKTGQETIDKCRENPETDLILMDIKMPGMNGYDATREIRKFNSDVIIIAQTAFGLSGDRQKAIDAGCNGYIAKPIKKDELLALIQNSFNKHNKQLNNRK